MTEERRAAAARGERKYIGKPCKHGHEGLRYTRNDNCVECVEVRRAVWKKAVNDKPEVAAAIAAGSRIFDGVACRKCGGTRRYISSFACVVCNHEYHKTYRKEAA